jgi:hypothetical protein
MSHTGLMDPEDKMLKFMMIMSAGGMHITFKHMSDSVTDTSPCSPHGYFAGVSHQHARFSGKR